MRSLRSRTAFSILGVLGVQGLSFVGFLVLARLLDPRDFGLMAVVVVLSSFLNLLVEMGMGSAIIQRKNLGDVEVSSVFWFLICCSFILAGFLMFCGPYISLIFGEPELELLLIAIAFAVPVNAVLVVPFSLLQKKGSFREVAYCELLSSFFGLSLGIFLAIQGHGVWALIFNYLTACMVRAGLAFWLSGWRPILSFNMEHVRALWGYSSYLFVAYIGHFLADNADRIIAAKLLGASRAGLYSVALRVAQLPVMVFLNGVTRVLFPQYSNKGMDSSARDHLLLVKLACFLLTPLFFFVFQFSEEIVGVIFGDKWLGVAPVLGWLCLAMIPRVVSTLNVPVFMAVGETRSLFWVGMLGQVLSILGMLAGGIWGGIEGIAIGICIARLVVLPMVLYFPAKYLGIRISEFVWSLILPGVCALSILILGEAQRVVGLVDGGGIIELLIMLMLSSLAYIVLSMVIQREAVAAFWPMIIKRGGQ